MASLTHAGTKRHTCFSVFHSYSTTKLVISLLFVVKLLHCVADDNVDRSDSEKPATFPNIEELYVQGVKAYSDQLWYKCAFNLESALKGYKSYKKTLTDCRMKCKHEKKESLLENLPTDLNEFSVFATFLMNADCVRRCRRDIYGAKPSFRITKELDRVFALRRPYQYLQFCWYKLDRPKQAASAAYTFYLSNPRDEDVKKNIAFYRDKARVPENEFIDLELKPYKEHYIRAMLAYVDENWEGVVDETERSLEQFFVEEERCRADCEDKVEIDETASPSFTGIIADHFVGMLQCQLGCEGNLSVVYTEPVDLFLSEQFHYLQYAYYKLEKIAEAVEATASYLLFHPDDSVVGDNKKVFIKKYLYSEDQFIPRKVVKDYVERRQKLQSLLDFVHNNLVKDEPEPAVQLQKKEEGAEPLPQSDEDKEAAAHAQWMDRYERLGLHIVAKEKDLLRPFRFAADGLLKQDQCEEILGLMEDIVVDGKGVQMFTLEHARKTLIGADDTYEASLRLYMRATEVLRHYTQRYYNMTQSLFFKNTSMVCWRQIYEPEVEADCIPQEFGTCDPEAKVRDSQLVNDEYVTVTYLTSQDDGDVYFLGENVSVDISLGVKVGRTIGFQAGDRHGLHIPMSAPRCAMVNSYTAYRSPGDEDYTATIAMLHRLEEIRMEAGTKDPQQVLNNFRDMGVQVVKNSSSLHGGERFVADGMASDAECESLKNMVMDMGTAGDGYNGRKTPHTSSELFAGLNLNHLIKSGALMGDGYAHQDSKPSFISPHSEHELFQGLTIYRASKLMHMGLVNTFAMRSFLDLSEKSRLFVEKYFNLTSPLYFDFTHLVCRSAIDESQVREDLSHPVHSDNCVLQTDGTCLRDYPAFIQRDYSALLYLNDDFEGGDFFFAYSNTTEQISLRPRCGRLVGFKASEYHGVKAIRSGTRCALALWFTHNPNFKELAHVHARKVLHTIQDSRDARETGAHTAEGTVPAGQAADTDAAAAGEKSGEKLDDAQHPGDAEKSDSAQKSDSENDQISDDPQALLDEAHRNARKSEDAQKSDGSQETSEQHKTPLDPERQGAGGGISEINAGEVAEENPSDADQDEDAQTANAEEGRTEKAESLDKEEGDANDGVSSIQQEGDEQRTGDDGDDDREEL